MKKSSKRKQKLYEKFLKERNALNETAYKTYENSIKTFKQELRKVN